MDRGTGKSRTIKPESRVAGLPLCCCTWLSIDLQSQAGVSHHCYVRPQSLLLCTPWSWCCQVGSVRATVLGTSCCLCCQTGIGNPKHHRRCRTLLLTLTSPKQFTPIPYTRFIRSKFAPTIAVTLRHRMHIKANRATSSPLTPGYSS
jgi:hypothetical protein